MPADVDVDARARAARARRRRCLRFECSTRIEAGKEFLLMRELLALDRDDLGELLEHTPFVMVERVRAHRLELAQGWAHVCLILAVPLRDAVVHLVDGHVDELLVALLRHGVGDVHLCARANDQPSDKRTKIRHAQEDGEIHKTSVRSRARRPGQETGPREEERETPVYTEALPSRLILPDSRSKTSSGVACDGMSLFLFPGAGGWAQSPGGMGWSDGERRGGDGTPQLTAIAARIR